MLGLSTNERLERVLVIGCHADDIEIGCGGTLLVLMEEIEELHVDWVVLAATGARAIEARASAEAFLTAAGSSRVDIYDYRDGFLPYVGGELKQLFEELKQRVDPQLVFTHGRHDLHQDHRLACELTWNTFRNHMILEYEIPKYDGDLGNPNLFVPLSNRIARKKTDLLEKHFRTQGDKHWFDGELFMGLMRLRGMEAAEPLAEAFTLRKAVFRR